MLVSRITRIMSIYVFTVINRNVIGSYYITCLIQLGHSMNGRVHVNAAQTTLICSINKEYPSLYYCWPAAGGISQEISTHMDSDPGEKPTSTRAERLRSFPNVPSSTNGICTNLASSKACYKAMFRPLPTHPAGRGLNIIKTVNAAAQSLSHEGKQPLPGMPSSR